MAAKQRPTYRVAYVAADWRHEFYIGPSASKAEDALQAALALADGDSMAWLRYQAKAKGCETLKNAFERVTAASPGSLATPWLPGTPKPKSTNAGFTGHLHFATADKLGYVRFRGGVPLRPNNLNV